MAAALHDTTSCDPKALSFHHPDTRKQSTTSTPPYLCVWKVLLMVHGHLKIVSPRTFISQLRRALHLIDKDTLRSEQPASIVRLSVIKSLLSQAKWCVVNFISPCFKKKKGTVWHSGFVSTATLNISWLPWHLQSRDRKRVFNIVIAN